MVREVTADPPPKGHGTLVATPEPATLADLRQQLHRYDFAMSMFASIAAGWRRLVAAIFRCKASS